jgi:hypothetical protein
MKMYTFVMTRGFMYLESRREIKFLRNTEYGFQEAVLNSRFHEDAGRTMYWQNYHYL